MKKNIKQNDNLLINNNHPSVYPNNFLAHLNDLLLEHIPCGVLILEERADENGTNDLFYLAQNKLSEEYFGSAKDDLLNKSFTQFPGILSLDYLPIFKSIIKNGGSFQDEFIIKRPNKNYILEMNCSKFSSGLMISLTDITKINELKNQLKKKEALLLETQAIAGIGSFEWDLINNTFFCTQEIFSILGFKKGTEINIEEIKKLVQPDEQRKVEQYFKSKATSSYECEVRINIENEKIISCILNSIYDEVENLVQVFGTLSDVTARKHIEEELTRKNIEISLAYNKIEAANKELEKVIFFLKNENSKLHQELGRKSKQVDKINKDLDNFVYSASHDLQSPLSNIEGLLSALIFEIDPEKMEALHIVELLMLSLGKVKKTLHDMSAIAEVQELEEGVQTIDFSSVFDDVKFSIHEEILKYSANIEADFSEAPNVYLSRNSLRVILLNLITNALKYSSPLRHPQVTIKTYKENNNIVLSVKDNGLGIKAEDKEKIFLVFKRVYTHVAGSGIGLYLVKRIVENNDGKIDLDSQVNKGSTFKVYLKNDQV